MINFTNTKNFIVNVAHEIYPKDELPEWINETIFYKHLYDEILTWIVIRIDDCKNENSNNYYTDFEDVEEIFELKMHHKRMFKIPRKVRNELNVDTIPKFEYL